MKKLCAAYVFAIFLCSSTQVRCSIFDNFLFGSSSDSSKGSSDPTELPRTTELSNATLSEAELVIKTINSTIDEEFFDLLNASENILVVQNSSGFQENATKQSVKKQLVDIPPKPPVTWQPRPAFGKESVKTTTDSSSGDLNVTLSTDEPEEVVLGTTKASVLTKESKHYVVFSLPFANKHTLGIERQNQLSKKKGITFLNRCS